MSHKQNYSTGFIKFLNDNAALFSESVGKGLLEIKERSVIPIPVSIPIVAPLPILVRIPGCQLDNQCHGLTKSGNRCKNKTKDLYFHVHRE